MSDKIIEITCKGSNEMPLEDLQYFQGNLKTLDQPQFDKLKRSIFKHGFSFPVFVWNNQIIDGHQRIFVTRHLVEQEGYIVDGDIPVVEIQAKDHNEAAEKLLLMTSRYGEVTDAGLFSFIMDHALSMDDILEQISIPEVDLLEFAGVEEKTQIQDAETRGGARDLGKTSKKIRPVLYSENVHIFEDAIRRTRKKNYSEALIEICQFYLDHELMETGL